MKTYPATWPALVAQSHVIYASCNVITGTTAPVKLRIVEGSVTFDRTNPIPSEFTATAVDPLGLLTASGARDLLQPFIHEVMIRGGAKKPDGTIVAFDLGVFGISRRTIREEGSQVRLELAGKDRAERIAQPLSEPWSTAGGFPWDTLLRELIRLQFPDASFTLNWPVQVFGVEAPGRLIAPDMTIDADSDVWSKVLEGAANISKEIPITPDGRFDFVDVPQSNVGNPVWSYIDGRNAAFIDATSDLDSENIYQGVRVKGIDGVVGEAWDDNPASLTSRIRTEHSRLHTIESNVGTQLLAEARADAQLASDKANAEQVTITAHPNYALELRDLVAARSVPVGIKGNFLANRIELPLGGTDLMTVAIGKR